MVLVGNRLAKLPNLFGGPEKESGIIPLGVDGIDVGNWVVVDFGSLLVHVFEASSRQLYQLDVLVKNQPGARIVRQN